ncbi:protein GRINL1A [Aulostomus maculatus]
MSSSWTERQGQVGDLRSQSKEELQELLLRQNKILSNKRLLQTLPDKGKKIREFAERVQRAIEHRDEEERKRGSVSVARMELQSKYQQAFTVQQCAIQDAPASTQTEDTVGGVVQEKETSPVLVHVQENPTSEQRDQLVHRAAAVETMDTATAGASLDLLGTKEGDLAEVLDRLRVSEPASTGVSNETKDPFKSTPRDNYFLRKQIPNKPHYVTVLERTEKAAASSKQKFKPNQMSHRSKNSSPGSSSPNWSSEGSSPLSAQARKEQDRKHLDDITAAKLPPLHHTPAQLLSLQESAALLREQTKKQQELQAKLAAQKLSEGLKISMGSYPPDGSPMAAYREVHDEGAQLSSEED